MGRNHCSRCSGICIKQLPYKNKKKCDVLLAKYNKNLDIQNQMNEVRKEYKKIEKRIESIKQETYSGTF